MVGHIALERVRIGPWCRLFLWRESLPDPSSADNRNCIAARRFLSLSIERSPPLLPLRGALTPGSRPAVVLGSTAQGVARSRLR